MSDPIRYQPLGTVEVDIDEKTYRLGLPKFKQYRHFERTLRAMSDDVIAQREALQKRHDELTEKLVQGESKKLAEQIAALEQEVREFNRQPFYDRTVKWVVEAFDQLGDPLPDPDDWPAWLAADTSLPHKMMQHWKTAPKASGVETP